jgi:light-regulated signal transduction histidine kinase (bacteriophytochrome)
MEFGPEHRTDENIATLTESATRMRSTIDSLLLFAQVGHAEIEIDPIKMRDLAE